MDLPDDIRLDEFNREEWWDVARYIKPDITEEEFEAMWDEFFEVMAARKRH